MNKQLTIGVIVLSLVVAAVLIYQQFSEPPRACTMEARICPDGTAVGRTGPNCEFAACPGEAWQTFVDDAQGVSFQYPEKLLATYITTTDWPPQPQLSDEPFICVQVGLEGEGAGKTELRLVDSTRYCRTVVTNGAAGSIYSTYTYAVEKNNRVLILTFSLRMVQCGNYDEPQKTQCENEREAFDIDGVVDRIMQTAEF